MMQKIRKLKIALKKEGFIIKALTGSFVTGNMRKDSDIDIIFDVTPLFRQKYKGWDFLKRIDQIRKLLEKELGKEVDLIDERSMGPIAKKYMERVDV